MQVTAAGQQIIVRVVNPGELFGFAVALGRKDYPGTPLAAVDSSVLARPMEMMTDFMARSPALAVNTMQMIGRAGWMPRTIASERYQPKKSNHVWHMQC